MRFHPHQLRIACVCAGMVAIAAALACTCTLPLSLRPKSTEALPPVFVATQPPPTLTSEHTATPTVTVTVTPTVPVAFLPTKTSAPSTITLTVAPPPGGGSWGIVQSDLELYGVSPVSPVGTTTTVTLDVRNNGPHDYEGSLRVVCVGPGFQRTDPVQVCPPAVVDTSVTILQGVGTGHFNVDLYTSPVCYYPGVQCSLIVPDNKDPNTGNNQYGFAIP